MKPRDKELLLQQFVDGQLDDDSCQKVLELMKADPTAFESYCDYARLDADLNQLVGASPKIGVQQSTLSELTHDRTLKRSWRAAILAAAAAVVLLAVALRPILVADNHPPVTFRVSPETRLSVEHLSEGDDAPDPGTLSVGSRMTLHQGSVELVITTGVRAVVKGPADLTLQAEDKLFLASGDAWFDVPAAAIGFQVQTPELLVTDLGTKFGVISDSTGSDEIHVIQGKVRALTLNGTSVEEDLGANEARLAGTDGRLERTPIRKERFLTTLPDGLPYLHWSFDKADPLQVEGTHPAAATIALSTPGGVSEDRLVPGVKGHGMSFHDDESAIATDWVGIQGRTPRTFACWIKLAGDDPRGWGSVAEWGNPSPGAFWRLRVAPKNDDAHAPAVIRVGYTGNWIDGETHLADGEWHHVAVVESETLNENGVPELHFYVDGKAETLSYLPQANARAPIETQPGAPLTFAKKFADGTRFRGELDEVFLFTGALSQDSIVRLMRTHQP